MRRLSDRLVFPSSRGAKDAAIQSRRLEPFILNCFASAAPR